MHKPLFKERELPLDVTLNHDHPWFGLAPGSRVVNCTYRLVRGAEQEYQLCERGRPTIFTISEMSFDLCHRLAQDLTKDMSRAAFERFLRAWQKNEACGDEARKQYQASHLIAARVLDSLVVHLLRTNPGIWVRAWTKHGRVDTNGIRQPLEFAIELTPHSPAEGLFSPPPYGFHLQVWFDFAERSRHFKPPPPPPTLWERL